ncbi:hypothetical protein HG536_0B01410 [Torulaspora globosa]|uniref:Uncharacterized protein n=1 Tax=Torulaspora globosa TaxID=48254 RepID=A0A7G3ZCP3_9SACH|nr:uncharacterized protein HG536_0B01410 [Torulaspora globosa]QLL31279.1 hypothetical protein HG536_0B01410 [Torulaspora globosa]
MTEAYTVRLKNLLVYVELLEQLRSKGQIGGPLSSHLALHLVAMLPRFLTCHSLHNTLHRSLYSTTLVKVPRTRSFSDSTDHSAEKVLGIIQNSKKLVNNEKPAFRDYWKFVSTTKNTANSVLRRIPIDSIAQFVNANKLNSSTVRGFYRREMIYNLHCDFQKIQELAEKLHIDPELIKSKTDILAFCINDSIKTKDIMIAVEVYLLYYKLYETEPLNNDLCQSIISALAFENPRYDHIHLLKFLELDHLHEIRNTKMTLTRTQIATICNKALALEHSPILTKSVLDRAMNIELTPISDFRNDKIIAAYHLIERDYAINNAAGVFLTWTTIKNYYTSVEKHDPRIIYKLINIFTHHKAYRKACKELVASLSPYFYSNNALLLPSLIDYATKTNNLSLARELMNNVNKFLDKNNTQVVLFSKRCLSSMLRMHLKFKDSNGVDRVLKYIQESFGKPSEENLSSIVSHLVEIKSFDNLKKAVQLVDSFPTKRALLAYASIINKIVEWQIASDDRFTAASLPVVDKLLRRAHIQDPNHKSSLWNIIASLFIKKIVHHRNFQRKTFSSNLYSKGKKLDTANLDLAKLLYLRSKKTQRDSSMIDVNPFIRSSPHKIVLKITDGNRFVILRNIALNAIKGRRKDIFLWCCSELYQHGMPVKELLLDWNMMLDHQMRRASFPERKQIDEKLSIGKLAFISKNLK